MGAAVAVGPGVAGASGPRARRAGRSRGARLRYTAGVGLATGLLVVAVPSATGVAWSGIVGVLRAVPAQALAVLVGLWLLGLLAHTVTLTAALPTLTHRRALTLSLTGSAVANVLPLGGAAGVALNHRMLSTWGYGSRQFATYTVVTNLWDVVAKLALPVLVLPVVLCTPSIVVPHLAVAATVVSLALVGVAVVATASLTSRRGAALVGRWLDRLAGATTRWTGSPRRTAMASWLVSTQESCRSVVRQSWARLTVGMTVYTALLLALLVSCLSITGADLAVPVVLVGFTVERLLTLAGLTPGGAGVVEVGLAGVLVLLGGSAAAVVPGVLLYRALTFGLEIPVGGATLVGWLLVRRGLRGRAGGRRVGRIA